jgi:hypothetical protein
MSEPEQDRVDSEDDELQPSLPMGPGEDQQSRF